MFAVGATVQSSAVGRAVTTGSGKPGVVGVRQMAGLLTSRRWLGSIGVIALGAAIHIAALALAPVSIVQPVGVLAIPFAVVIDARRHGRRPAAGVIGAVALTVAAVTVFVLLAASDGHNAPHIDAVDIGVAGALLTLPALALAALGAVGPRRLRCLAWAGAGAVVYGLASALLRADTMLIAQGDTFRGPVLWFTLAVGAALLGGGWAIQQAHANGPPEIILACLTVVDPIIAVVFGLAFLGEGTRLGPVNLGTMVAAAVVATAGVVMLSHHHPETSHPTPPTPSARPIPRPAPQRGPRS